MAVDMFLTLDGIKGESKDSKHAGEIEILSFSWGGAQSSGHGAGGGGGAGKVSLNDFSIMKELDTASPQFMELLCNGQSAGSGLLTLRKAGEKPLEYLKIKMTDVFISSYQTGGSGSGAGVPVEQVSFSFSNVEISTFEQKQDGSLGGEVTTSCNFGGKR